MQEGAIFKREGQAGRAALRKTARMNSAIVNTRLAGDLTKPVMRYDANLISPEIGTFHRYFLEN